MLSLQVQYEADKPCSLDFVEETMSTFDDLMKWAKWIDRYYPTSYAANAKNPKKPAVLLLYYYEYVHANLPGDFRPRMMPSGLWEYKNCYPSEELAKPVGNSVKVPAGGETENVYIASADLVLD